MGTKRSFRSLVGKVDTDEIKGYDVMLGRMLGITERSRDGSSEGRIDGCSVGSFRLFGSLASLVGYVVTDEIEGYDVMLGRMLGITERNRDGSSVGRIDGCSVGSFRSFGSLASLVGYVVTCLLYTSDAADE